MNPPLAFLAAARLGWLAMPAQAEEHEGYEQHQPVSAGGEPAQPEHAMDHSQHGADQAGDDPHAQHRAMMAQMGYKRSEHMVLYDIRYVFPGYAVDGRL